MAYTCLFCAEQLGETRREFENSAKMRQQEHSATVAAMESNHTAAVTGTVCI